MSKTLSISFKKFPFFLLLKPSKSVLENTTKNLSRVSAQNVVQKERTLNGTKQILRCWKSIKAFLCSHTTRPLPKTSTNNKQV